MAELLAGILGDDSNRGIGQRLAGGPVEDVALDLRSVFARDGHVAPIIECLLQRSANVFFRREIRNPALHLLAGFRNPISSFISLWVRWGSDISSFHHIVVGGRYR